MILEGAPASTLKWFIGELEAGNQFAWCFQCHQIGAADPVCPKCGGVRLAISLRDARATLREVEA